MDQEQESFRQAVALRERLLTELDGNPTFQALRYVEKAVAVLGASTQAQPILRQTVAVEPSSKKTPQPPKPGSRTAMIQQGAAAFLRERGRRAQSAEIVAALKSRGIEPGGKRPNAVLAAYLSHSPLFDNEQGEGYGLTEWKTETPNSGELFGAPKRNGSSPLSP